MCLGQEIQQFVMPNAELTKMLKFLRIIGFINFAIVFLRLILGDYIPMIYDLMNVFILYMACKTLFFVCIALYIIFCFFTSFYLFISLATFIQATILELVAKTNYYAFAIYIFIFCFYIFAIFFAFKVYREMKALYLAGGVESKDITILLFNI